MNNKFNNSELVEVLRERKLTLKEVNPEKIEMVPDVRNFMFGCKMGRKIILYKSKKEFFVKIIL